MYKNNDALVFELLITAAMAVIIFFSLMNIGVYINGTVNTSLTGSYLGNTAGGSINVIYWNNATGNGTTAYRNTSLPSECSAGEIQATSGIGVYNNGTDPLWFNLSSNGNWVYNQTINPSSWYNRTIAQIITGGDLSSGDTYVNYSWINNRTHNRVRIHYVGSYFRSSDYRTSFENMTVDQLDNISGGFDDNIDIMIIAAIVTVITIPLAAVIAIKKLL